MILINLGAKLLNLFYSKKLLSVFLRFLFTKCYIHAAYGRLYDSLLEGECAVSPLLTFAALCYHFYTFRHQGICLHYLPQVLIQSQAEATHPYI